MEKKEGSTTAAKFAPTWAQIEKVLILTNCIHVKFYKKKKASLDFGFWKNHRKNRNPLNYGEVQGFFCCLEGWWGEGGGMSDFFQVGGFEGSKRRNQTRSQKEKEVS
jgi:hypothetical protein